jgi:hypothetical protein
MRLRSIEATLRHVAPSSARPYAWCLTSTLDTYPNAHITPAFMEYGAPNAPRAFVLLMATCGGPGQHVRVDIVMGMHSAGRPACIYTAVKVRIPLQRLD